VFYGAKDRDMTMLSCKQVLASLSDYVDDEASVELRKTLEEHIAWCRRCRVVFDSTTKMLKILVDAEPFEVPLAVSARLYSRLEKVLTNG
jgi:predicted anti-sigma-YlaC factor YlaD